MIFDENYNLLPNTFNNSGKSYYIDPIRQKLILITPEETVRQRMISFLIHKMKISPMLITVEEPLSHYGVNSKLRADIIILATDDNGDKYPLCVIECKAPDIPLAESVSNQMFEYCDYIEADYAIMTNGISTISYKYEENSDMYLRLEKLPTYRDMIKGKYIEYDYGEYPERIPFNELCKRLKDNPNDFYDISPMTDFKIAFAALNLYECLLDYRVKLPVGDYGMFKVIEDFGIRLLSYGNSAGGRFFGPYRSFFIEYNGNTIIVSLSVTTYWKSTSDNNIRTALVVAIDNESEKHHALQMVLDDNLIVDGDVCNFFHNGRIAIGNIGSGRIEELRLFVGKERPEFITGKKFYLGSLVNDRLWRLDDPKVVDLIIKLISYSLIRDEYRKYKKSQKYK